MILATWEEFESEGPEAIYIPAYQDFPYFKQRADFILENFPHHERIVVWGCGWGYTVKHLVDAGRNAIGCDASQYAIDKAKEVNSAIADRFFLRDITQGEYDFSHSVVITEDLLPCLEDDECEAALKVLRRAGSVPDFTVHMLTSNDRHFGGKPIDLRFNWKPSVIWRRLVYPDWVYDVDTNEMIP